MVEGNLLQNASVKIWAVSIVLITFTGLCVMPGYVSAENNKPAARIDGTLKVKQGKTVYLDGSFSSDPDRDNLDYQWTLLSSPEGSIATLGSSSDAQTSYEADAVGTYKVKLVVNDGSLDSDPAYAEISVTE